MAGNVNTTQEDQTGSGERTDVRIVGANTILLLELKQKPTKKGFSIGEIRKHEQLHSYMADLVKEEKAKVDAQEDELLAFLLCVQQRDVVQSPENNVDG